MILNQRIVGLIATLLLLTISGCSRETGAPETDGANQPLATIAATITSLTPEPTATSPPSPEPTPIVPEVEIGDQRLGEDGLLTAQSVSLPAPGWLAIHRMSGGEPVEVIGSVPLAAGVHESVEVTVDPSLASESLYAWLHLDVGAEGAFEYPGEDEPFPDESGTAFTVELALPHFEIEVSEQAVAEDGIVTLDRIEVPEPSWVLVHAEEDGVIGDVLGGVFLEEGEYDSLAVSIDWRRASPNLYAVVHEDDGEQGVLEFPDGDNPVLSNGQPVVAEFRASFPPEVLVYDQPIIENTVTIERAISVGPGWLAIYNDVDGQPGFIIGSAALEDGLNEQVVVELLEIATTPQLFARIHEDTQPGDDFNFPAQDPAVLQNNRLPRGAPIHTDRGAHVFVNDQRLNDENGLTVSVVVTPVPTWVAIYSDDQGAPGDLLGQTWVAPGINRDVLVGLEDDAGPGIVHLALFEDLGDAEEFEVPVIDPPLRDREGSQVHIPFSITTAFTD